MLGPSETSLLSHAILNKLRSLPRPSSTFQHRARSVSHKAAPTTRMYNVWAIPGRLCGTGLHTKHGCHGNASAPPCSPSFMHLPGRLPTFAEQDIDGRCPCAALSLCLRPAAASHCRWPTACCRRTACTPHASALPAREALTQVQHATRSPSLVVARAHVCSPCCLVPAPHRAVRTS